MLSQSGGATPRNLAGGLIGAVVVIIGAGAFAACLRSAFAGMRDVMITDGGSCGSGGPYVIARHCSAGDIRLTLVGIIGGLVAAAVYAAGASSVGGSAKSAGLVCWVAGFGALSWGFIGTSLQPPAGHGHSSGFLISGITFVALAIGGLVPLVYGLIADLRPGPASTPAPMSGLVPQPIVRAVIPPGLGTAPPATFGGWSADGASGTVLDPRASGTVLDPRASGTTVDAVPPPSPRSALTRLAIWLGTSAVGAAVGLVLSSSLVSVLK